MTPAAITDPTALPTDIDVRHPTEPGPPSAATVGATVRVDIWVDGTATGTVAVPAPAATGPMADLFARLSTGQVVTLVPAEAELTVAQAADVLLTDRPYVLELIGRGEVPTRGTRLGPLVRYADLIAYKRRTDADARQAVAEMTREAQSLGLYD